MVEFGDLAGIMGKVKDLQGNMQRLQEELSAMTVEADSGGGMVTVRMNGKFELLDIRIDSSRVDVSDVEMLEDLIRAAVNLAVSRCQQQISSRTSDLTGNMNIPGLDQLGGLFGK